MMQACQRIVRKLIGPRRHQALKMLLRLGYWPNFDQPRTFNEILASKMLADAFPDADVLADKLAVREVVAKTIGAEYLIPLLYHGADPAEIPFASLPGRYVVKCNHDSGGVMVVTEAHPVEPQAIVRQCRRWLARTFGDTTNEPWYARIKPCVLVEAMLSDETGKPPPDYKFWMFHGQCRIVQIDSDRFGRRTQTFYDPLWNRLPFRRIAPAGPDYSKPLLLAKMIAIAETLAHGREFARIDLYALGDRIYFGEFTMAPMAASGRFTPHAVDVGLGDLWSAGRWPF